MDKGKRLRDMTWDDYGISKERYKELKAFCMQYDEKKRAVRYGAPTVQACIGCGCIPHGLGIGQDAIKAAYVHDCHMIEEAAVRADPGIWRYILKSVTQGLPYESIEHDDVLGRITVGKTDFYAYRKLSYHFLDEIQIGARWRPLPWPDGRG